MAVADIQVVLSATMPARPRRKTRRKLEPRPEHRCKLDRRSKLHLASLSTEMHLNIITFPDYISVCALSASNRQFHQMIDRWMKTDAKFQDIWERLEALEDRRVQKLIAFQFDHPD
jgi:hypothetical protein